VQAVPTGSGTVAGTTGAALLALAGVGGVAVLRTRRRPAVDGGSSDA
jgi:MYXO-CTERM domain-containing protein